MKKHIKLELFIDKSNCYECGSYSMLACKIKSSNKSLNVVLGSADCCELKRAEILDAILYLDERLNFDFNFSDNAKEIMKKNNTTFKQSFDKGLFRVVNHDYSASYIDLFDLEKYNGSIINMLKSLLLEKEYDFSFLNLTGRSISSGFILE